VKDDRPTLLHIRDAIGKIEEYTNKGEESFFSDSKTQDAVVRNIEIIGEASKNLSSEIKKMNSEIPWKKITGMRDKVIHEYFGINLKVVWNVVKRELPSLKKTVEEILNNPS